MKQTCWGRPGSMETQVQLKWLFLSRRFFVSILTKGTGLASLNAEPAGVGRGHSALKRLAWLCNPRRDPGRRAASGTAPAGRPCQRIAVRKWPFSPGAWEARARFDACHGFVHERVMRYQSTSARCMLGAAQDICPRVSPGRETSNHTLCLSWQETSF